MWSHDIRSVRRCMLRLAAVGLLAGMAGGCFQPLYGDSSAGSSPGLRSALSAVDVLQIDAPPATAQARLAVELRNELTFLLNGGSGPLPPTHRLAIDLRVSGASMIVDPTTARPEFEIISMDANYRLTEAGTGKVVVDGIASSRTTYDIPGQQQRYAMLRGQRDAQGRAAKVVAEQIRARLASYFAAGT